MAAKIRTERITVLKGPLLQFMFKAGVTNPLQKLASSGIEGRPALSLSKLSDADINYFFCFVLSGAL